MTTYTTTFMVGHIRCEIDFRADCREEDAPSIGEAIVAGIMGAEYSHTMEKYSP